MKIRNKLIVFMFLTSVSIFSQNFVDGLRLSEPGVISSGKNLAMGNAALAVGTDYSGVLINPATLGMLESEVNFGFYFSSYENNSNYFNAKLNAKETSTQINELSFVYKIPTRRGSLVIGIGYNKLKDFNSVTEFEGFNTGNNSMIQDLTNRNSDLTYDLRLSHAVYDNGIFLYDETFINGNLFQKGTLVESGNLENLSFSAATEIAKDLYIGGSLNFIGGTFTNDRNYAETDVNNVYDENLQIDPDDPQTIDFVEFTTHDNYKWDISGFNLKGGFVYDFSRMFTIGGSIESSTSYFINEEYFVEGSSYFENNYSYDVTPQVSTLKYEITTPMKASFGGSLKVPFVILFTSIDLIDYSEMELFGDFDSATIVEINEEIRRNLDFAPIYHFGLASTIPFLDLRVKAGTMLISSPYKDKLLQSDKEYVTFGLGFFSHGPVKLDFATAYGSWKEAVDIYGNGEARVQKNVEDYYLMATMKYKF